ncbi:TMEM161B [Branchiostoma lanceolatum]|uniref:TMEM161B protein n=1 Tax=Branchiostoma lanceolatum TaxID=7740 RepID=A0A8J9ZDZ1_BRALA|nr:TMEM161B [Branchiostoma lanceolatum]
MGVIGTQLVVSMVMASIIQKLQPHFSAARWLLSRRLVRYLHPTDDHLRELAGVQAPKGKGRKRDDRRADGKTDKEFTVPCNINLQLETAKVERVDIIGLQFYTEYQWLVDFSACALVIYLLTEGSLLCNLTSAYFTGDDDGERSICLVFGFFFLLVSMAALITTYTSLSDTISGFLGAQGMETSGASSPSSKLMFKGVLAVYSGLVGAFLTFSGLRFGKMHQDSLQYSKESPLMQLLLHLNFLWPLVIVLLWVKPLARGYVLHPPSLGTNSTVPVEPLMSEPWFETSRLYTVIFCVVLRLVLMHRYLQSYLNMAHQRIEYVKKQAGRISNMEIQKRIVRVFFYLCVVAVQYLAPVVLLLFYTMLLKTLGEYSWTGTHVPDSGNLTKNFTEFPSLQQDMIAGDEEPVKQAAQQLTLAFASLRNIFSVVFFRGVVSYICWWSATAVFVTNAFGMIYHSVFTI